MSILILLIIIILFFIIIKLNKLLNNVCNKKVEKFIIKGALPGNKILLLGGIHGNEYAGSYTLLNLLNTTIPKGQLTIIPQINKCGLILNTRENPLIGDLNRDFKNGTSSEINKEIMKLINEHDLIIDLHEGFSWRSKRSDSIGSTLTPINLNDNSLIEDIIKILNTDITEDDKKFMIITDDKELLKKDKLYAEYTSIEGTLDLYCKKNGKKYLLIEITGQNDIQPLELRYKQFFIIIREMLNKYL